MPLIFQDAGAGDVVTEPPPPPPPPYVQPPPPDYISSPPPPEYISSGPLLGPITSSEVAPPVTSPGFPTFTPATDAPTTTTTTTTTTATEPGTPQDRPNVQPGTIYVDVGDGTVILAPRVTTPPVLPPVTPGEPTASDDAGARGPSLLDFGDPLDETEVELFGNPPLEGQTFVVALRAVCEQYRIDPLGAACNGLHEGFSGAIGDGGYAYGPFQDWMTYFRGRPWYGKGANNATVNRWAWSRDGIEYSVRSMARTSARDVTGPQSAYLICTQYERPTQIIAEANARADLYRSLVGQTGLWDYIAGQAKGPAGEPGSQTTPAPPATRNPNAPAGVQQAWGNIIDVYDVRVRRQHGAVKSLASDLIGVFK